MTASIVEFGKLISVLFVSEVQNSVYYLCGMQHAAVFDD